MSGLLLVIVGGLLLLGFPLRWWLLRRHRRRELLAAFARLRAEVEAVQVAIGLAFIPSLRSVVEAVNAAARAWPAGGVLGEPEGRP